MKKDLEVAAALFRQDEAFALVRASGSEQANLYRGLALLADGLRKIERRFEKLDAETNGDPAQVLRKAPKF